MTFFKKSAASQSAQAFHTARRRSPQRYDRRPEPEIIWLG